MQIKGGRCFPGSNDTRILALGWDLSADRSCSQYGYFVLTQVGIAIGVHPTFVCQQQRRLRYFQTVQGDRA